MYIPGHVRRRFLRRMSRACWPQQARKAGRQADCAPVAWRFAVEMLSAPGAISTWQVVEDCPGQAKSGFGEQAAPAVPQLVRRLVRLLKAWFRAAISGLTAAWPKKGNAQTQACSGFGIPPPGRQHPRRTGRPFQRCETGRPKPEARPSGAFRDRTGIRRHHGCVKSGDGVLPACQERGREETAGREQRRRRQGEGRRAAAASERQRPPGSRSRSPLRGIDQMDMHRAMQQFLHCVDGSPRPLRHAGGDRQDGLHRHRDLAVRRRR